jgi:hypothetical protein
MSLCSSCEQRLNGVRPQGPESDCLVDPELFTMVPQWVRPQGPESGLAENRACDLEVYRLVRGVLAGRADAAEIQPRDSGAKGL